MSNHQPAARTARALRISSRPFLTFALALSPMLILAAILYNQRGWQPLIFLLAIIPLVLYALFMTIVVSQRIIVRTDGIETTTLFYLKRFIPYSTITRTDIQHIGERPHPTYAFIHTKKPEDEIIRLNLKPLVREDAAWLCALPEINPVALHLKNSSNKE